MMRNALDAFSSDVEGSRLRLQKGRKIEIGAGGPMLLLALVHP